MGLELQPLGDVSNPRKLRHALELLSEDTFAILLCEDVYDHPKIVGPGLLLSTIGHLSLHLLYPLPR